MFTMFLLSQTEINQLTENGQKTGEWIKYHENGKIDEAIYYKPGNRRLTEKEAFSQGLSTNKDTIIYFENYLWKEKYEYNVNWELKRILRTENSKLGSAYYYGPNKEVVLKPKYVEHHLIGKVGEVESINIELTNTTENLIVLQPTLDSKYIFTDNKEFSLPANASKNFTFDITFASNSNNHIVVLKNDSINIDFSLKTTGYHFESKDIKAGLPLSIGKEIIYYRTDSEALLKLYDAEKKKVLQTFSLGKEWTKIDLNQVKPGRYFFSIIDYKLKEEFFCEVNIGE